MRQAGDEDAVRENEALNVDLSRPLSTFCRPLPLDNKNQTTNKQNSRKPLTAAEQAEAQDARARAVLAVRMFCYDEERPREREGTGRALFFSHLNNDNDKKHFPFQAEARQAKHDASPYGKAVKKQQASEKAAAAAAAGGGTGRGGPDARDWLS